VKITFAIGKSDIGKLTQAAHAWEQRKRREVEHLLTRTALAIERDAQALAPADGGLRDAIRADLEDLTRLTVTVGTEGTGAVHTELGTSKVLARPFLKPAYDKHTPGFLEELKRILSTT
jgi:hypothetical protein